MSGLTSWQKPTNHNRMIDYQSGKRSNDPVELAYYGSSAFKITSPSGITIMIDPWRNIPTGKWDWYFHDFPETAVDIGVSTHAHFDHDALHRLDSSVNLDRLIGSFEFADVKITGIADKHATDSSDATYDFQMINRYFGGQKVLPPDNSRSWDNCIIKVETGRLSIVHWGDNRHNPPDDIWQRIGDVDILLMPVDDSQHVMGHGMVAEIIERIRPKVVVPHHYYIWNVVQRQSTLLPASQWLQSQPCVNHLDSAVQRYSRDRLPAEKRIDHFGDFVAFDVDAWHRDHGMQPGQ
jgi:L-ascorbate metabolism protein UlaG (beta-lactamase superfamily)